MKKYLLTITAVLLGVVHAVQAEPLANPLGTDNVNPNDIIGNIIRTGLSLLGIVALCMFLYGGLQIFLSRGNPKKIDQGRDTLIWAAIGLVVIFSSYALVSYVLSFITTL